MSESGLPPSVKQLAEECHADWPTMKRAAAASPGKRLQLAEQLQKEDLVAADTSVVVFGSLARNEWTTGSDLDWTMLVDGQVQSQHADIARRIKPIVEKDAKAPGPTGVFGGLTFSHEMVHFIGGDDDSNTNTTRRILLLLESKSLTDEAVRTRVLRALLERYVGEDLLYHEPRKFLVPRFLLNDYVRYWRTMGVDSAQKRRNRVEKWALRNIKLRLSRKLIFAAGFWACLSCRLRPSKDLETSRKNNDREGVRTDMTACLFGFTQKSPLEALADAFLAYEAWEAAKKTFDAYEDFLAILDSEVNRKALADLKVEGALGDPIFGRAKKAASAFQDGLTQLFFNTTDELTKAAQIDGVF
jgi:predicted nucleotidyltransferase